jgi:hypothetical protein
METRVLVEATYGDTCLGTGYVWRHVSWYRLSMETRDLV